jgi:hypothetical protein
MFKRHTGSAAIALLMTIAFCGIASGGNDTNDTNDTKDMKETARPPSYYERISPELQFQCDMLGGRMKTAGKEMTVYEGELFDAAGKSSLARATVQLPGLAKLEGFINSKSALAFDGDKATGAVNRSDEALLEMFLMDMPEAIIEAATRTTTSFRLLGRNFGPDRRDVPNYTGPRYDIYIMTTPIVYKKTELMSVKKCYFNSVTGLLQKVAYSDQSVSPAVKVETRFSAWGIIDGSTYPGQIERYEDGKLVFSFIANKITGGPGADASNFR